MATPVHAAFVGPAHGKTSLLRHIALAVQPGSERVLQPLVGEVRASNPPFTREERVLQCQSAQYRCTLIDTPSHGRHARNIARAVAMAPASVLVLSARTELVAGPARGQVSSWAQLGAPLSRGPGVVAATYADTVDGAQFAAFAERVLELLRRAGVKAEVRVVPVIGLSGANVAAPAPEALPWWDGPTLLEAAAEATAASPLVARRDELRDAPLRLHIARAYRSKTVAFGMLASGTLRPGNELEARPDGSGRVVVVERITEAGATVDEALPGMLVGVQLSRGVARSGAVLVDPHEQPPPDRVQRFTALLLPSGGLQQVAAGTMFIVHSQTASVECRVKELKAALDPRTRKPVPTSDVGGERPVRLRGAPPKLLELELEPTTAQLSLEPFGDAPGAKSLSRLAITTGDCAPEPLRFRLMGVLRVEAVEAGDPARPFPCVRCGRAFARETQRKFHRCRLGWLGRRALCLLLHAVRHEKAAGLDDALLLAAGRLPRAPQTLVAQFVGDWPPEVAKQLRQYQPNRAEYNGKSNRGYRGRRRRRFW